MTSATPAEAAAPLTLGPLAPAVRRTLGPVTWAALECLAERSAARGEVTVSCRSVRELAGDLGLAKDTVARALQRLQREGLVTRVSIRGNDGRFGRGHYMLSVPGDVFARGAKATPRTVTQRPRIRSARPSPQQLLLIDDRDDGASR